MILVPFSYTFSAAAACAMLIIFLLNILVLYKYARQQRSIMRLASHHYKMLIHHYSVTKQLIKVICFSGALCALAFAFLRPRWGSKEEIVELKGRDVVIALDISRSMLAQDVTPSRLKAAQQKIQQLVDNLASDRVSLLIFSGAAVVQCPLTHDYAAFSLFLHEIDEHTLSSGSTDIAAAIAHAIDMFKRQPPKKERLLILVTDGEDFSPNLHELQEQAKELNLQIFILGVGTQEGAPIPLHDQHGVPNGHQKDEKGEIVITKLNEPLLQNLAQSIGGHYVLMTSDQTDINAIQQWLERHEQDLLADCHQEHQEDRYYYFTAAALLLLLVEWLL